MAYCYVDSTAVEEHGPVVVFVNEQNKIVEVNAMEEHGDIKV